MVTDPLADLFTRIRNAYAAKLGKLTLPHSQLKAAVAAILLRQGYLQSVKTVGKKPHESLKIELKYLKRRPALTAIRRVSKPGVRHYVSRRDLAGLTKSRGAVILSTSRGVMTARDALAKKIGGEILGKII